MRLLGLDGRDLLGVAAAESVPSNGHARCRPQPRATRRPAMLSTLKAIVPTVTNMIRADHTHVLATFHQYEIDTSPGTKQALVNTICLALEIHAQLEEEIFYPAMREIARDAGVVGKSVPEHDEMRRLIAQLRTV